MDPARTPLKSALALLLLVGGGLAFWTWGTWPDPLIDFGRELYAAWRVSLGDRLHRDLAWFNGPLSAWWNGALFWLCGASLSTLVCSNLACIALVFGLIVHLLRQWSDAFAALAGGALFLSLFAFHQYVGIGNYNFVTPYSHELTHGFALALALLALLGALERRPTRARALAIGVLLALVSLTKVEMALAAWGTALYSLTLGARHGASASQPALGKGEGGAHSLLAPLPWIALAAGLVWTAALVYLASALGWRAGFEALLSPYRAALDPRLRALPFYRGLSGMDAPLAGVRAMASNAGAILAALGLPFAVASLWPRARAGAARQGPMQAVGLGPAVGRKPVVGRGPGLGLGLGVGLGLGLGLGAALWFWLRRPDPLWFDIARGLPLIAAASFLHSAWRARSATQADAARRARARARFALFATLALAKIALNARLVHYGFVLALPASLLLTAIACGELPARLERTRGRGAARVARLAALGLLLGIVLAFGSKAAGWYGWKKSELGSGADAFRVATRGRYAAEILSELERRLEPDEPFLVLPEGVMLNYLARRATPGPHLNFMPPEVILFGEERILAPLRARPPRFVVLAHKDTSEYGYPMFGRDYAARIGSWLVENYRPVHQVGAMPLSGQGFGIAILEYQGSPDEPR